MPRRKKELAMSDGVPGERRHQFAQPSDGVAIVVLPVPGLPASATSTGRFIPRRYPSPSRRSHDRICGIDGPDPVRLSAEYMPQFVWMVWPGLMARWGDEDRRAGASGKPPAGRRRLT